MTAIVPHVAGSSDVELRMPNHFSIAATIATVDQYRAWNTITFSLRSRSYNLKIVTYLMILVNRYSNYYFLINTLNFALRERGLVLSSSSPATVGFLVNTLYCSLFSSSSFLKACLTILSSPE